VVHSQAVGSDGVAEMERAMDAAQRFEILSNNTQALNADWGKLHNPWENTWPKRWGEGQ
jgi:hypothetical protein